MRIDPKLGTVPWTLKELYEHRRIMLENIDRERAAAMNETGRKRLNWHGMRLMNQFGALRDINREIRITWEGDNRRATRRGSYTVLDPGETANMLKKARGKS